MCSLRTDAVAAGTVRDRCGHWPTKTSAAFCLPTIRTSNSDRQRRLDDRALGIALSIPEATRLNRNRVGLQSP
jgi:hypothetical protein